MKKITKVAGLVLGSMLLFSCVQKQEKAQLTPERTVIAGEVRNFSGANNVVLVHYCDYYSDEGQFAQNLAESDGQFHAEHAYLFAQNMTIRIANRFINVFVYPGDSVFVTIDAAKLDDHFDEAVTFSGNHAGEVEELFAWNNYVQEVGERVLFHVPFDTTTAPADFLTLVGQHFAKQQDTIAARAAREPMSDFIQRWAAIDSRFVTANYLQAYKYPAADRWAVFTDPVFDVFNEDNFQSMYFPYHLSVCMDALVMGDAEISRLVSEEKYAPALQLTMDKLHEKAPEGMVRDAMLFGYLKAVFVDMDMPELYDSLPGVRTAFSQEFFAKELERIAVESKKVAPAEVSEAERQLTGISYLSNGEAEALPEVKIMHFLSEKYKGKVVYIDAWATWCPGCIQEFKSAAPALHRYFEGKEVVFVNLCMESTMENWKRTIAKYAIGGEQYLLGENASKLFRGDYNLPGFPTYLMLTPEGKLYNPVPRPSNMEEVIQLIEVSL